MSRLELLGYPVLAVTPMNRMVGGAACLAPGPRLGTVCSLADGHDGPHEIQVPALVTIDRFTSDTENPMQQPDPDLRDAAERRSQQSGRDEKPRRPRSTPAPRDVRPTDRPDQR